MQFIHSLLCFLALGATHATKVDVTPVQKVVQLMQGMLEKGKKEKNEEQVGFASKTQFCTDTKADKNRAIEDEKQTISNLKAAIASQTEKIARLAKKIASNQKDADAWSSDIKAATKVRLLEKSDFDKTNQDYGESIDALGRAISTLKAKSADKAQATGSLIQVSSLDGLSLIPESAKKAFDAFIQEGQAERELFDAAAPPEANAYEFQSQGVVDMLSKLEDKFIEERTTLQKEETSTKHAHLMLLQNLNAQVAEANKDIRDHTQDKLKTQQAKAGAESDLNEQNKLLASDTKYLKDLTASCATEAAEFEAAQQMRADELVAIEKAVSIISSGSVAGKAEKHFTLLQQKKGPSFGQLRSTSDAQIQGRVAKFLHAKAAELHSRVLEMLALRASADPMKKVKNMIKDLIVKLMEESTAEADHKGFCDTALQTNQATRTEKTNEVQELSREIDQLNGLISRLTSEVAKLNKQVVSLDKAMAKSTGIRTADKVKNKNTVTDSQEAQEAVAQALTVLKEFYQKAADAADASSFVQAPYTGMGSENGGVTGMLEVIESDFARLEASTKATEASDQKEYDEFMTDSNADKAGKKAAIQHKSSKKLDSEQSLNIKKNDLEGTQKELNAALHTFEKLKPSCVNQGVSYEDRVAKRKEEIQSMKEALQVLEGNDVE